MSYTIEVHFDSYWNLLKPAYVFKFRAREYKMLRGRGKKTSRERDCILSILNKDDKKEYYKVYRDIMIYCACLAWQRHTPIKVGGGGGHGSSAEITIKKAHRMDVTKRTMPVNMYSLSIERIPYVTTRDQEDALGLYREALVSGSPFYKFLCLWNILNIPSHKTRLIIEWINDTINNKKSKIYPNHYIDDLKNKGVNIGGYLDEECRDAIAHIRRSSPNRTHIDPNNGEDFSRIGSSAYFLEDLVKIYVKEELGLTTDQFLFKTKKTEIPEYLSEEEIKKKLYRS